MRAAQRSLLESMGVVADAETDAQLALGDGSDYQQMVARYVAAIVRAWAREPCCLPAPHTPPTHCPALPPAAARQRGLRQG